MVSKSASRRVAQERARELAAAQRRAQARRQRIAIAAGAVAVVLVAVGVLVLIKVFGGGKAKDSGAPSTAAPAVVVDAVTKLPPSVLDQVGTGKVETLPKAITGQSVLTDNGKPLVVYLGAEYCPFCAAQRWALVVALSRFGTFSNLGQTHSGSNDVFPDTPTLSFHGSGYTSQYLVFQGVETEGNTIEGSGYTPLDKLTAQQEQLLRTFDAPPYVDAKSAGSIPFLDFANQAMITGASFSPQLLAGKSVEDVATALADPGNQITQSVAGAANAFTAILCKLTNNQPGDVCTSKAATVYQGKLGGAA